MADLKGDGFIRQCLVFGLVVGVIAQSYLALAQKVSEFEHNQGAGDEGNADDPLVFVAMLVRNKAHTLPWFLHYFENLDYPKWRMQLWIRSDHNEDNSAKIVQEWLNHVADQYKNVDFVDEPSVKRYGDDESPFSWPKERFENMIRLREQALESARLSSSDYLLMVDVDNFLLNPRLVKDLIKEDRVIIAPMLNTSVSEHYSNFWCGMDSKGYYVRTPDYLPILRREKTGVFEVPMVHSTVLVELRKPASKRLSFYSPPDYSVAVDDIIGFAHSAKFHGVPMHVMNRDFYGFMLVPMESRNTLEEENDQFIHLKLEYIIRDEPLQKLPYIEVPERPLDKLGFDEIFLINLVRRPDRRQKMLASFHELGINATIIDAVDGKQLNDTYLALLGVVMLPGYADPYHGSRAMTMGEVGCFLSHYVIWEKVLANRYQKVIVFEDDVRFRPYFIQKLNFLMEETKSAIPDWDLIYLGRKRLQIDQEMAVDGTDSLVWPHYSYWTLSYIISYNGALKLIQQNPLKKLVPVDEFLPIMFDKHPETAWKENFYPRNLISLSAYPLFVEPTHYTGEEGYITDTEDSPVIGGIGNGQKRDSLSAHGMNEEL